MKRPVAAGLILVLLAALLLSCLPQGGRFGYGQNVPRPEFAGSPMAQTQEMEE